MTTTPTPWKGSTQINSIDTFDQYNAQITPLRSGGYIAVWTDTSLKHNPHGTTVVGQVYDVLGNKVGGEVSVTGLTSGDQYDEAITTLANGNVAVAFVDHFGSGADTLVRIFDPTLHLLRQDDLGSASGHPAIAALAGGGYAIASTQSDVGLSEATVNPAGVLGLPRRFPSAFDQVELATLSNGNFVAVMEENSVRHRPNLMIFGPDGAPIHGDEVAGTLGPQDNTRPDVAPLKGGGFVVVWTENADIRLTLYTNSGAPVPGAVGNGTVDGRGAARRQCDRARRRRLRGRLGQ